VWRDYMWWGWWLPQLKHDRMLNRHLMTRAQSKGIDPLPWGHSEGHVSSISSPLLGEKAILSHQGLNSCSGT
jgi:hypothetical protein